VRFDPTRVARGHRVIGRAPRFGDKRLKREKTRRAQRRQSCCRRRTTDEDDR
jgi:hypothetical protein